MTLAPPQDLLRAFGRAPGRALMLGHVHPDADVLGTLLAAGLALEKAGWSVVYGGPHPAPASLEFLPGIERYVPLARVDGRFGLTLLTDCPNPERTEGLIDQARAAGAERVLAAGNVPGVIVGLEPLRGAGRGYQESMRKFADLFGRPQWRSGNVRSPAGTRRVSRRPLPGRPCGRCL